MAQTFENLQKYPGTSEDMIQKAIAQATEIVKGNLADFTDFFQSPNTENGFYWQTENVEWTTGFWTGVVWLAYELTKDEAFKKTGEIHVDSFLNRIEKKIDVNYHDMGFLYSLSCVAAYKLCQNENGKKAAIMAADHLLTRYRENGEFIQAWGNVGDPKDYRLIIDCLLNLPLLYWATEVTGNPEYADKACRHIHTAMQCVLREDHSTYHTYYIDPETGKPSYGVTHQGNRNGSAWARGQAWGLYGFTMMYRETNDPKYLRHAEYIADFLIHHPNLPADGIPYWDYSGSGVSTLRDTSAASIMASALIELSTYSANKDYFKTGEKILKNLSSDEYLAKPGKHSFFILKQAIGNYLRNSELEGGLSYADYYYVEGLLRYFKQTN